MDDAPKSALELAMERLRRKDVEQGVEERAITDEIDRFIHSGPTPIEMERCRAQAESQFVYRLQTVGGFGGKADQLNAYYMHTGMPDFFEEDLARYRSLSAADIRSAINRYLPKDKRVELSIVPEDKQP